MSDARARARAELARMLSVEVPVPTEKELRAEVYRDSLGKAVPGAGILGPGLAYLGNVPSSQEVRIVGSGRVVRVQGQSIGSTWIAGDDVLARGTVVEWDFSEWEEGR